MRMSLILMFLCNIANKLDQTGIIYIEDFWATDLTLHEAMDVLLQKNDSGDTEFWQRSEHHGLGSRKIRYQLLRPCRGYAVCHPLWFGLLDFK